MKPAAWFVALAAAAIAFAIAFGYPAIASEPVAWYYPTEHAWAFEVRASGIAMDFYGRLAQALVAWVVVFAGTALVVRRRAIGTRAIALSAAWTITAVIFVMLFFLWTLHYRVPVPLPTGT